MHLRVLSLIIFSILLAGSEAAKTRSQTKTDDKTSSALKPKFAGVSKPSGGNKNSPVVAANQFTNDPRKNPLAKDPKKAVGTKSNPAAVHYDPKKQGDQTQIIKSNPNLSKPFKLDTAPDRKKPADIRADRYKQHGTAKPGKSKEDQPPASFGDKPGRLYNINPQEQKPQAVAVNKANREARKTDGWVQQVIYSGSSGSKPDPIPLKKQKTRRGLLRRSLLARMVEKLEISEDPSHMSTETEPVLQLRFLWNQPLLTY